MVYNYLNKLKNQLKQTRKPENKKNNKISKQIRRIKIINEIKSLWKKYFSKLN